MDTIGYCGLGHMGGAVARRLATQVPLIVYDKNPDILLQFSKETGCETASTAREFAARCDVLFLCLPTSQHVEAALFDDDGIAAHAKIGALIVDQTSGDPRLTAGIAKRLSNVGTSYVDAPVSGGPAAAAAGKLVIMAGGEEADIRRLAPVLKSLTCNAFQVGRVGAGHALKVANNLITAAQRLVTLEALSLAAANGVHPATAVDVLSRGSARNYTLEYTLPRHILNGQLFQGCSLATMHKDVEMAAALGSSMNIPLPFANEADRFYRALMDEHGATTEINAMAFTYERLAGVTLTPASRSLEPDSSAD